MTSQIAAIGFDFDHTLGIDNRLEHDVALEILNGDNGDLVDRALAEYRAGARPLDDALAAIRVDAARFRRIVIERAPRYVEPLPGALSLLEELRRRGTPTGILSNGWSPLQERKAELVGFSGPVLVSDVIGVRKPSAAAFGALERMLHRAATAIAYVGDDPGVDIAGALAAGMSAVWFDWEGKTYPQELAPPTLRIASLMELLAFLPGPISDVAKRPA